MIKNQSFFEKKGEKKIISQVLNVVKTPPKYTDLARSCQDHEFVHDRKKFTIMNFLAIEGL
jgi:hypothetical protein